MTRTEARASVKTASPVPKELLTASRKPDVVSVPKRQCLAVDGAGSPASAAFQDALGAVFGVAYALKFARKKDGAGDFKIGPVEGRWSAAGEPAAKGRPSPEQWRWRLRIGVPLDVKKTEVERMKREVVTKKGGKLEGSPVVPNVSGVHGSRCSRTSPRPGTYRGLPQ
jgi:hypothetical protein